MDENVLQAMPQYDEQETVVPLDKSVLSEYSFGTRVAEQIHATTEVGRKEVGSKQDHRDDEPPKSSAPVDYHENLEKMDHDERVAATAECLNRRGSFRDILYGLLGFCVEEKSYEEIEPFVEGFVEFCRNRQEPRRYVFMLLRTGGLEEIELKEDGTPLTKEDKQAAIADGLEPEDVDVLVFDWRVATTEVGREVYADFNPSMRLKKLVEEYPDREEAFAQIMAFCREPQTMGAIDDKFKGKSLMGIDEACKQKRQPSSYVDKLGTAGAIAWSGSAWSLADAGKEYLKNRESELKG
jgi:hypothetical protein